MLVVNWVLVRKSLIWSICNLITLALLLVFRFTNGWTLINVTSKKNKIIWHLWVHKYEQRGALFIFMSVVKDADFYLACTVFRPPTYLWTNRHVTCLQNIAGISRSKSFHFWSWYRLGGVRATFNFSLYYGSLLSKNCIYSIKTIVNNNSSYTSIRLQFDQ